MHLARARTASGGRQDAVEQVFTTSFDGLDTKELDQLAVLLDRVLAAEPSGVLSTVHGSGRLGTREPSRDSEAAPGWAAKVAAPNWPAERAEVL